jgi:rhodanese-related sulfurtransferase
MMGQLSQFIMNHWGLWLALVLLLVLLFINERLTQKKRAKEVSPQTAVHLINHEQALVVDLRDSEAFRKGHIIDSVQACAEDFTQERMTQYKEKPLILVCARGLQSAPLATRLKQQGFKTPLVLAGGIAAWQNADLPLVKGK